MDISMYIRKRLHFNGNEYLNRVICIESQSLKIELFDERFSVKV